MVSAKDFHRHILKLICRNYKNNIKNTIFTYIKNCDPFVLGPLLAIDNKYGRSCLSSKFSSKK